MSVLDISQHSQPAGVSVEMPPADSDLETITLRGEPDKLGVALTQVYEKANSVVSVTVNAPRWLHRFIIGRKGQNIKKITQDLPKVCPCSANQIKNPGLSFKITQDLLLFC